MKRLAARDLENLLQVGQIVSDNETSLTFRKQCAIPVFDGLLPEPHNRSVLELLFVMAHWHALAKLRLHTDITLAAMDSITVLLGIKLRLFQSKTCSAFSTRELIRERDARVRRQNPKTKTNNRPSAALQHPPVQKMTGASTAHGSAAARAGPSSKDLNALDHDPSLTTRLSGSSEASVRQQSTASWPGPARREGGWREKAFNLNTYKFHALGDYAATIRQFGTTDSYSTEMVSPFPTSMFHSSYCHSSERIGTSDTQTTVYSDKSQRVHQAIDTHRATAGLHPPSSPKNGFHRFIDDRGCHKHARHSSQHWQISELPGDDWPVS
jgi:hypothetical protein